MTTTTEHAANPVGEESHKVCAFFRFFFVFEKKNVLTKNN